MAPARKGLTTMLVAAFAVLAHVVLLVAPSTCRCAPERAASAPMAKMAKSCCCAKDAAPMSCHGKERSPASSLPADAPAGCAASASSCHAEPPLAMAGPQAPSMHDADPVAPVLVALELPDVAPPLPAGLVPWDESPGPPPIGLLLTRCTVLLI